MTKIIVERSRTGVVVISAEIALLLTLIVVLILSNRESADLRELALWTSMIGLAGVVLIWQTIQQVRITFSTDGIRYPRLGGGELLRWEEIDRVDRRPGSVGIWSGDRRWNLVLAFFPDRESLFSVLRDNLPSTAFSTDL